MFYNHLKVAFRTIWRQKGLSFINLIGLSVGIGCFSLFLLYAINEFSFNRFHKKGDRIYQVVQWIQPFGNRTTIGAGTFQPIPLAPALEQELPDVARAIRYKPSWKKSFVRTSGQISQAEVTFADTALLTTFTFPLIYGNVASAFSDPYHIVLTEKQALKLFGESNPVGKVLEIKLEDEFEPYVVGGVVADIPTNSSLRFEILGNFERILLTDNGKQAQNQWDWSSLETFVELRPGSGLAALNGNGATQLQDFFIRHHQGEVEYLKKEGLWKSNRPLETYRLMPLLEMHTGKTQWLGAAEVDPGYIWMLLAIAMGVLLIACINFTTLSIGRSAGRAQEVGVRKVLGSNRKQLMGQFLTEALLMSIVSAAMGLLLAQAVLPWFNTLADRELIFSLSLYPEMVGMLIGLILMVGLLAGVYPAVVLSGFIPVEALKSKFRVGGSNLFTKSLVTTQFVLSITLAIATTIILQQVQFMRSENPGFKKDHILVIDAGETDAARIYPKFRQMGLQIPQIQGISSAEMSFGPDAGYGIFGWDYHGEHKESYQYIIDSNFMEVLGMELVAGSNFQPGNNQNAAIVNEAFVKNFGWTPDEAIGQSIDGFNDAEAPPVIRGVVKDFHFRSLREKVDPQLFVNFQEGNSTPYRFFVRLQPGDPGPALEALASAWSTIEPTLPFNYTFLDEDLNRFYQAETRLGKIIGWAGGIAIFLACLGLLGLVALAVVNRTKEIGIRKVLGATESGIVQLLAKDFLRLVAIAVIIASPLGWYFMSKWLQGFAYHISIHWWVFFLTGVLAVGIAFVTISFQSIRAALANPIKSLRNE